MTARLEKRVLMEKRRGVWAESGQTLYETEQGRTVHIKILSRFDNVGNFFGQFKKRKVPSIVQIDIILRIQQTYSLTSLFQRRPIILSIDKCDWHLKFRILFFGSVQGLNLRPSGYEPNQFSVISVAAFSASNVYI